MKVIFYYYCLLLLFTIIAVNTGCKKNYATLYVFAWSDYFDPDLIADFEQQNNCHIVIDSFDSNEAMFAKLKAGAAGYDIILPSTYQVKTMFKENLIMPLNHSLIPNVISNFNHELDNQIQDKEFNVSVPYACTYTGLMCKKADVGDVKSWKVVADKKFNGRVTLLDDIREVIGIGLMHNGFSLNSEDEDEIMTAAKTIISWKSNVRKFDSESYKLEVADGSSIIGHGYSSDAAQIIVSDERDDIAFILPDEGFTIAWDEFVISSSSKQPELAHKFIDFFYDDDNAYQNMLYICSLSANKSAFNRLDGKFKDIVIPKNIDKGQLLLGFDDPKTLTLYNRAWDMIKSTK